jgi:hypothetical protein
MSAYDTFADAANSGALKVVLEGTQASAATAQTERVASTA